MLCHRHAQRIAVTVCARCGCGICSDCQMIIKGGDFCPDCAPFAEAKARPGRQRSPWEAVLFAVVPGFGQVYNGQVNKGIAVFILSPLIFPWIWGMYDAYRTADRVRRGEIVTYPSTGQFAGCLVLLAFAVGGPFLGYQVIRHYQKLNHVNVRETRGTQRLTRLGKALEAYARDHQGQYPVSPDQLYFKDTPYLAELVCGMTLGGYQYRCDLTSTGYLVTALPQTADPQSPGRILTLRTGLDIQKQ